MLCISSKALQIMMLCFREGVKHFWPWWHISEKVSSISDLDDIYQRRCQVFLTFKYFSEKLSSNSDVQIFFWEGVKLSWPSSISEKVSSFPDLYSIFQRRCQAFLTFIVYIREGVKLSWPLQFISERVSSFPDLDAWGLDLRFVLQSNIEIIWKYLTST